MLRFAIRGINHLPLWSHVRQCDVFRYVDRIVYKIPCNEKIGIGKLSYENGYIVITYLDGSK